MFLASRVLWLSFVGVVLIILALCLVVASVATRHPVWTAALYALADAVAFTIELAFRRTPYPAPPEPPEPPPRRRFAAYASFRFCSAPDNVSASEYSSSEPVASPRPSAVIFIFSR